MKEDNEKLGWVGILAREKVVVGLHGVPNPRLLHTVCREQGNGVASGTFGLVAMRR